MTNIRSLTLSLLILLLGSGLGGCGFQLQGSNNTINDTSAISLGANDIYTGLYREFKRELERQGFSVAHNSSEGNIHLIKESFIDETRSYTSRLDPAEQELELQVNYRINAGNQQTMIVRKSHTYFRHEIAGKSNELENLRKEMRLEAIRNIIQQYQIIKKEQPETANSDA